MIVGLSRVLDRGKDVRCYILVQLSLCSVTAVFPRRVKESHECILSIKLPENIVANWHGED